MIIYSAVFVGRDWINSLTHNPVNVKGKKMKSVTHLFRVVIHNSYKIVLILVCRVNRETIWKILGMFSGILLDKAQDNFLPSGDKTDPLLHAPKPGGICLICLHKLPQN